MDSIYLTLRQLCLPLLLLAAVQLTAQTTDSTGIIRQDSLPAVQSDDSLSPADSTLALPRESFAHRFFTKNYPNPRKAAFMSLAVPGLGQAYNRKWWKLPVVYGTLGGLIWLEARNINVYTEARDNYKALVDEDPATMVAPKFVRVDRTSLKRYRDDTRKSLEQSSLILGFAYLFTAADAFVDAHLSRFDVSDDLSLKVCPKAIPMPGIGAAFGMSLAFAF